MGGLTVLRTLRCDAILAETAWRSCAVAGKVEMTRREDGRAERGTEKLQGRESESIVERCLERSQSCYNLTEIR